MAIFDCFTFFNELDILQFRMELLNDVVDYFVLVESNSTHHGEKKRLYFTDNRERYSKYFDKIIYVFVDDIPEYKGEGDMSIVNYLRNAIMRGLVNKARPDDYIIVSDVDEIPNPDIIRSIGKQKISLFANRGSWKMRLRQHLRMLALFSNEFVSELKKGFTVDTLLNYTPIGLEYDLFYYYMNCKCKLLWTGPYIAKYAHMMMPHEPRELSYLKQLPIVKKAGWHFSYLGGMEAIKEKLSALSDPSPELEKRIVEAGNNEAYIQKCLDEGIDILGRKGSQFEYNFINKQMIGLGDIDSISRKYPQFFREHND